MFTLLEFEGVRWPSRADYHVHDIDEMSEAPRSHGTDPCMF